MNKKDRSTSILMLLGMLFVALAGGVFITSSWGYFSNEVKEISLVSFMILFFAGSIVSQKVFELNKAATCFFYLGGVFAAFCTYKFARDYGEAGVVQAVTLGLVTAFILCFVRLFIKKSILDLIFSFLILDIFAIALAHDFGENYNAMLIAWAATLIFFAVLYKFKEKIFGENTKLKNPFAIMLLLQMILNVGCLLRLVLVYFVHSAISDSWLLSFFIPDFYKKPMPLVVPFMILAIAITIFLQDFFLTQSKKLKALVEIILLVIGALLTLLDLNVLDRLDANVFMFVCLAGFVVWQIIEPKKLAMVILAAYAFVTTFVIVMIGSNTYYPTYLPYAFVTAIPFICAAYKRKKEHIVVFGIYMTAVEVLKVLAIAFIDDNVRLNMIVDDSIVMLCVASFAFALSAITIKKKRVFATIGIFFVAAAAISLPEKLLIAHFMRCEFFSVVFLLCLLWARRIWKDKPTVVKNMSLTVIFVNTFILFMHNALLEAKVPCALIFGGYLIVLVAVGIFKDDKALWITHLSLLVMHIMFATIRYWGVIPWWIYLVLIGLGLIVTATVIESKDKNKQKEKISDEKENIEENNTEDKKVD